MKNKIMGPSGPPYALKSVKFFSTPTASSFAKVCLCCLINEMPLSPKAVNYKCMKITATQKMFHYITNGFNFLTSLLSDYFHQNEHNSLETHITLILELV